MTKADIRRVANKIFVESNRTSARIEFTPPAQAGSDRAREVRNEDLAISSHAAIARWLRLHLRVRAPSRHRADACSACQPTATKPAAGPSRGRRSRSRRCTPSNPSQPKRIELANGLVIFLQEDHELPFINGTILIRGGSRDEPADKVGMVRLYGEAWRTSGQHDQTATRSTTSLRSKAASIETGGGGATTSLELGQPQRGLRLASSPGHRSAAASRLQGRQAALAKRQMEAGIARRNDDAERHRRARGDQAGLRRDQPLRPPGRSTPPSMR